MKNNCSGTSCQTFNTLQLVGNKWVLVILIRLGGGTLRFGELLKSIGEISPKVLTQQLKKMEKDGIVKRKAYATIPPKVEYSLTEKGVALGPVMEKLIEWGEQYGEESLNE